MAYIRFLVGDFPDFRIGLAISKGVEATRKRWMN